MSGVGRIAGWRRQAGAALCGMLVCADLWAGGFQQAFQAALTFDPGYRAARQELASSQQTLPLARAGQLPNFSFSASDARVTGTRTSPDFFGRAVTSPLDYRSPQQSLSFRYPLLNVEAKRRVQQAHVQLEYADAVLATRLLDLLDRLSTGYLQSLQSDELVRAARVQLQAATAQRAMTERRTELGEGTRAMVAEAAANVQLAQVQLREAENERDHARATLRDLTGQDTDQMLTLEPDHVPVDLAPDDMDRWVERALADNATLRVRRLAVELARTAIARAAAGHFPRLDLVASISTSRNESVSSLNQSNHQRALGLQLNVPLYSGGYVGALVDQAKAEHAKAEAELVAEELSVARQVRRLFQIVSYGTAKVKAYQSALVASATALEGARRGLALGLSTEMELVQARRKHAEAQRDLARVRFEDLLSRFRLNAISGVDPVEVVSSLDQLLRLPIAAASPGKP